MLKPFIVAALHTKKTFGHVYSYCQWERIFSVIKVLGNFCSLWWWSWCLCASVMFIQPHFMWNMEFPKETNNDLDVKIAQLMSNLCVVKHIFCFEFSLPQGHCGTARACSKK